MRNRLRIIIRNGLIKYYSIGKTLKTENALNCCIFNTIQIVNKKHYYWLYNSNSKTIDITKYTAKCLQFSNVF